MTGVLLYCSCHMVKRSALASSAAYRDARGARTNICSVIRSNFYSSCVALQALSREDLVGLLKTVNDVNKAHGGCQLVCQVLLALPNRRLFRLNLPFEPPSVMAAPQMTVTFP